MANLNEGHRARLRQRMKESGLRGFRDHEILELLLFQYIPRKDTNKIAHALLNKFGNFANIFDATPQELQEIDGISEVTACNLCMLKEVWNRYRESAMRRREISSLPEVIDYARELLAFSPVEKLVAVFLDNSTHFLLAEEYTSGSVQEVYVEPQKLVTAALRAKAAGVMLFHCHVKGLCRPSEADILFTERMYITLANLKIMLLDHMIFNETDDYFSFYQAGLMHKIVTKYREVCN